MVFLEITGTRYWYDEEYAPQECDHISINLNAINSIDNLYPRGTRINLNAHDGFYTTLEAYPSVIAKIKDAEDQYYFDNFVLRKWEDKKNEQTERI